MHFISHLLNHIMSYKCFSLFVFNVFCHSFFLHFFLFLSFRLWEPDIVFTHMTKCFFFGIFYNFSYRGGTIHVPLMCVDRVTSICTIAIKSKHTREAVQTLHGCHVSFILILKVCIRITHVPSTRLTLRSWVNSSSCLGLNLEWQEVKIKKYDWQQQYFLFLFFQFFVVVFCQSSKPYKFQNHGGETPSKMSCKRFVWKHKKARSDSQVQVLPPDFECFAFVYVIKKSLYFGVSDCWHRKCFIIYQASIPNK